MYPYEFVEESWRHRAGDPRARSVALRKGVTSPVDVFRVEFERQQEGIDSKRCNVVDSDVFIWARGEPDARWATKIGGVPHRPTDKPWPRYTVRNGSAISTRPMTFLAQFCFNDGVKANLDLPGDVLLVFVKDDEFADYDSVELEWHSLEVRKPMRAEDVPQQRWEIKCCHGYRWRTWDVAPVDGSRGSPKVLRATKIGGVASCSDAAFGPHSGDLGRFLCQLAEISPATTVPFPWINVEGALARGRFRSGDLSLGDAGVLCFYLGDHHVVNWRFECY